MSKNKRTRREGWLIPDPITGYDLVDVCLKIPDTPLYREAFLGAVYELAKQWNWDHWQIANTETKAAQAATYWRQLLFDHLKTGEDCMAQDCCGDDLSLSLTVQQGNTYLQNLITIFNQSGSNPAVLDLDSPNENFNGSTGESGGTIDQRNTALCNACQQFVAGLCQTIMASRTTAAGMVTALGTGLAIIGLFCPPAAFAALLLTGVGLALTAAAAGLNALSDSILGDEALRNGTACCMYTSLKDAALSPETFAGSLDSCSEWAGLNIAPLAGAVARVLKEKETYPMFLKALGPAFRSAELGLLPDCECDCSIDLEATGATLTQISSCSYQLVIPVQPATIDITRTGGGCFQVIDWGMSDPGWTCEYEPCGGGSFIQVGSWIGLESETLRVISARNFEITVTITVADV